MNNKRIIVSAGGTGGHIIPALVICEEFIKNGWQISYIGNKGSLEEKIVKNKGISFFPIDVQKLYRNFTFQHIKFPFKLIKSIVSSYRIIKEQKPQLIIGTGGFVSGPVGLAAILSKTPLYIHEQNCFPGLTTRFLGRYAKKVFIAYEDTKSYFPKNNSVYVGNPIFKDNLSSSEQINFDKYHLKQDSQKVLILGGSQGSLFINQLILNNLDFIINQGFEILWQSGKNHLSYIQNQIKEKRGIYVFDFSNELHKIYNSADMVICRAGALTLAEIEYKKLPSLIIPLPNSAGNHQLSNAMDFQKKGYAELLEQKDITLFSTRFQSVSSKLDKIKNSFKDSIHQDAGQNIYASIINSNNEKL
ncbi:MAG: undecaprenyldiphospho-muramoylpentapeptide beta-N-acetylglucosaminyltransferase [Candidatus Cloacimonadales bacterium]|jgi:UDP-N-acetylglucosamine--N-acetylmuramyl-(pentapeptide) pyrophosphoryl-undecaprenol N-acetylglucosamine transferase|nr:undecaprenyldiphospho-muramoylpentapeptide beta-N-acetylglucosaminyltransferase [Candidatus Cloacimonadota bacterium]MDD3500898.1 undecaprenyldiphospho-muramoylpentapeptide beta-N-acetylglucosaminyltransferase [Candidatus Cloacimonadota bacterium]MDX9976891.1 undecaprenyldiphospho-muramoylpentapeptide beta-N-acetylglucosaminyltransferase [Candidatus Cloacimonadales bacterium]